MNEAAYRFRRWGRGNSRPLTAWWQAGCQLPGMPPLRRSWGSRTRSTGPKAGPRSADYDVDRQGRRFPADPDRDVRRRDPNRYYVAIFGEPRGRAPWGWRFDGHHVVVQFTIADQEIASPTPTFFGANPAELAVGGTGLLRPLADEEDLAREAAA